MYVNHWVTGGGGAAISIASTFPFSASFAETARLSCKNKILVGEFPSKCSYKKTKLS